jgi:hypothetical protein
MVHRLYNTLWSLTTAKQDAVVPDGNTALTPGLINCLLACKCRCGKALNSVP